MCDTDKIGVSALSSFDALDYPIPIEFTSTAQSSVMFDGGQMEKSYADAVYGKYATLNISQNDHSSGIAYSTVCNTFSPTGTSVHERSRRCVQLVRCVCSVQWRLLFDGKFHAIGMEPRPGGSHIFDIGTVKA